MKFRLAIHAVGAVSLGLAAILMAPANVFGQFPAYGPPATSYASEAARYPGAASKPTPHTADGHPDLTGVWHHFFGELVHNVGGNSFALGFGGPAGAPRPKPDPLPEYKPELVAKVKYSERQSGQGGSRSALHASRSAAHWASATDCADAETVDLFVCRLHRQLLASDSNRRTSQHGPGKRLHLHGRFSGPLGWRHIGGGCDAIDQRHLAGR